MTRETRDPADYLDPDETVLWQGKPDPGAALPGTIRILRVMGWVMAAIFVFLALIGWANRDDLDGGGFILTLFLVNAGVLAIAFLFGFPALYRANRRRTVYAVTPFHAVTVRGLGQIEVLRQPVNREPRIVGRRGAWKVTFGRDEVRVGQGSGGNSRMMIGTSFDGLSEEQARAAAQALERAKGKAVGRKFKVRTRVA